MSDNKTTPEAKSRAEEDGNRRIAREIHDDFGQRAAAFAFLVQGLKTNLPERQNLLQQLDTLAESATALSEDLRRFSHDLHPARLDGSSLAEALHEHFTGVGQRHGLVMDLDVSGELQRLPAEIALALFRVAQEGLANTVRHAQARNVRLQLRVSGGGALLNLRDDGRGFDVGKRPPGRELGLSGIEERAAMFGGRCRIHSRPGSGTEIALWVPLPTSKPLLALWLLIRRHRGAALATLAILLAIGGGIFATWKQSQQTREQELRAEVTMRFLEELFEGANPRRSYGKLLDARGLLERGRDKLSRELADQPQQRARLLEVLGGIETELGMYDEARAHLQELLELRGRPGESELALAAALARLGMLAQASGNGNAVAYFEKSLAIREARQNQDDPDLLLNLNQLGTAYATVGKFTEAEVYLRRSLAGAERIWGPEDSRVATVLHNLAGLARIREDLVEAEKLLEAALDIRRKALGPEDPNLLESQEALALLRISQNRPAEAEGMLEQVLTTTRKIFGSDHPHCARLLLNLANARQLLGRRDEGLPLMQEAKRIAEKSLAPDQHLRIKIEKALAEY